MVCILKAVYANSAVETTRRDVEAPADACGPGDPAFYFGNSGYTLVVEKGAFD